MEGAPKIPSSQEVKKAAKVVAKGFSIGMAAISPVHNAGHALENVQRIEMPARPRDLKAEVAKEENGKLVIQAPTPEQMAQVLESKKETES